MSDDCASRDSADPETPGQPSACSEPVEVDQQLVLAGMRRRVRMVGLGFACAVGCLLFIGGVTLWIVPYDVYGMYIALTAVCVGITGVEYVSARRLLRRIRMGEVLWCPSCSRRLDVRDTGYGCDVCDVTITASELNWYWRAVSTGRASDARRWLAEHKHIGPGLGEQGWLATMQRWTYAHPVRWVLGGMIPVMVIMILDGWWRFDAPLYRLAQYPHLLSYLLAFLVFVVSYRRIRLATPHCAQCDYPVTPGLKPTGRCPECGSDWSKVIGTVRSRTEKKPLLMVVAVFFFLFGIYANFASMLGQWSQRTLSNDQLVMRILNLHERGAFYFDEWDALSGRVLSEAQQEHLLRGLVALRDEKGVPPDYHLFEWATATVVAGGMSQELVDAYLSGMFDVDIVLQQPTTPSEVPVETVGIEIKILMKQQMPGANMTFWIGLISGEVIAPSGESSPLEPSTFMEPIVSDSGLLRREFKASEAGAYRVRMRLWRVLVPVGVAPNIPFGAIGIQTLPLPTGAVWADEIVIERALKIPNES